MCAKDNRNPESTQTLDPSIRFTSFHNITHAIADWNYESSKPMRYDHYKELAERTIYRIVLSSNLTELQLKEIKFQAELALKPLAVGSIGTNKLCHIIHECDFHLMCLKYPKHEHKETNFHPQIP